MKNQPEQNEMQNAPRKTRTHGIRRRLIAALLLVCMITAMFAGTAMAADSGWKYYQNGSPVTSDWVKLDGSWFYFDSYGYMATGMNQIDGDWYYFYKDTGVMARSTTLKSNGYGYTFDSSGKLTNKYSLTPSTPRYDEPDYSDTQSYTVYITRTGSKYHAYGCQYLRQSCIQTTKSAAIANGYTACSRCNP